MEERWPCGVWLPSAAWPLRSPLPSHLAPPGVPQGNRRCGGAMVAPLAFPAS